jgi:AraC-like DNA-binding protein
MEERSKISRGEDAYVIHILLKEVVTNTSLWIDGREHRIPRLRQGGLLMANLQTKPSIWCHSAFEFVRCYVAKETLDTLGLETCGKRSVGLCRPEFDTVDPILFHLAAAAVPMLQRQASGDQLLIDQIALTLHRRVSLVYGGTPRDEPAVVAKRLLAWQERRVRELIEANLGQPVSLRDLADACRLSVHRFSRAFKQTMGCTPHRWLMTRRVEAAKVGLLRSDLPLTELFATFGFADASHFSRVFTHATGETPADWRRRRSATSRSFL